MINWFLSRQYRERIGKLETDLFERCRVNTEMKYRLEFAQETIKIREEQLVQARKKNKKLKEELKVFEEMTPKEVELRNEITIAQLHNELQSLNIERQKEVEDAFEEKPKKLV